MTTRIQDYAAVGDGRSVALISRGGSVDWLCWPRFDSPSLFARLLDPAAGRWSIAPTGQARIERRYCADTNVLQTCFRVPGGAMRVTDLMPISDERDQLAPAHELLRHVECESGRVELDVHFEPRPAYGKVTAELRTLGALGLRLELGASLITLRGTSPLTARAPGVYGCRLVLKAGDAVDFSLTWDDEGPSVLPPLALTRERILQSEQAWRRWAARASYQGPYRDAVIRSALTMKLLSFAPSGAVIAAPTTSLPERLGGDLNWDYRFCWLRDAAFTTNAFFSLGYEDEARAFGAWLLHATRLTLPEVRVIYDVYGRPAPDDEQELPHLTGYGGSQPVRVNNAAAGQLQLDTYGEAIDALFQLYEKAERLDHETQQLLRRLGDFVTSHWHLPDRGIWEIRGEPRHQTHSRVLCWTALDRLIRLGERGMLRRVRLDHLRRERARIRAEVEAHGFGKTLGSYTQTLDGDTVDVALMLLPWYGFEDPASPRMHSTWRKVRERLEVGPGLFLRNEESRGSKEGAFGICSFWVTEFLARGGGTLQEAREGFEQVLRFSNDLGLFAEEIDPATGDALGNFPQAYTHVGLINAALAIDARGRRS